MKEARGINLAPLCNFRMGIGKIWAGEIPGGNRSLVIKIIAPQIISRSDMSHVNKSGYFEIL